MKIIKIAVGYLLFTVCTSAVCEESVIENLNKTLSSVIYIESEVAGLFRTPHTAVRDKNTGKIAVATGIRAGKYKRSGAGVIVDKTGIAVTNAHIVINAKRITVSLVNGQSYPAEITFVAPDEDIAFIKIIAEIDFSPVFFSDSDNLTLNSRVFNVGASEVLKGSFSEGKVTGIGENRSQPPTDNENIDLIQTSFNVYKGDSGGPLLDYHGHFLGLIVGAKINTGHTSYAIPSNKVKKYLSDIQSGVPA